MKLILFILFLISLSAPSQIPKDKQLHLYAGASITSWTYLVTYNYQLERNKNKEWKNITVGLGSCAVAGISKEVYDEISYGGFDKKDLAATMIGGTISIAIIESCKFIFKKRKRYEGRLYESH